MSTPSYIFLGKTFTLREMQVISINAHGFCHRRIAAYLHITEGTLKTHLKIIRKALGLRSSRELTSKALVDSFDLMGNYNGSPLFPKDATGMPWPCPPSAPEANDATGPMPE